MIEAASIKRPRGRPKGSGRAAVKTCSIDGCNKPVVARGLCVSHYQRERRGQGMDAPLRERGLGASVIISTVLPQSLLQALKAEAAARKISTSQFIRECIVAHLSRQ